MDASSVSVNAHFPHVLQSSSHCTVCRMMDNADSPDTSSPSNDASAGRKVKYAQGRPSSGADGHQLSPLAQGDRQRSVRLRDLRAATTALHHEPGQLPQCKRTREFFCGTKNVAVSSGHRAGSASFVPDTWVLPCRV
ncbi:MAG: hypothetical protein V3V08_10865 [Nannocystaceae bacterium]